MKNAQDVAGADEMNEEEATNLETRKSLINLNQSLYFSEVLEHIELAIPFDKIKVGSELKPYMNNYAPDSLFQ